MSNSIFTKSFFLNKLSLLILKFVELLIFEIHLKIFAIVKETPLIVIDPF